MGQAAAWRRMNSQLRHRAAELSRPDVPTMLGVYAWYRDGVPVYSGRAIGEAGLQERIWGNHLKRGTDLSRSSFRRNVCEHLGIAPTSRTRLRPTVLTAEDVEPVNAWIRDCEVAWIACVSSTEAARLEQTLHGEWMPPLSRR